MNGEERSHSRLWQLAIALIVGLFGMLGFFVQRELNAINSRLDRIVDYVLATRKELNLPTPSPARTP